MSAYTITTESNAYFRGSDAVLHKDGKRVATLALKDEGPGVKVKVYHYGTDATRDMRRELPDDVLERVVENVREAFWHDADDIAQTHGYEQCFADGRSGGWCVPHPSPLEWWEVLSVVPEPERDSAYPEAAEERGRYFAFAEEITTLCEHLRTSFFDELLREAHAEWLVEEAEQAVEESRRFALFMGDGDEPWHERPESWDYDLTRGALIERVTDALRSIDEGGFVIRVDMTEPGGEH